MSDRRSLWIGLAALAVAVVAAVLVVVLATSGGPGTSASGASAGEIIFRSGRDSTGRPIPRSGGMMGGGMMGGACADCHGIDGHGLSTPMFTAPNITYANLTDTKGLLQPDGSRGPTYTNAGIRTAVTQGIDPEGDRLAWPMPQWQLTGQEWGDLLTYLKTLK